jgi:hypothetical protein
MGVAGGTVSSPLLLFLEGASETIKINRLFMYITKLKCYTEKLSLHLIVRIMDQKLPPCALVDASI